ncbi:DNA-3-methyladenine glycosylase I [Arthrobacter glacialis]|uniref:DNA-3-methyladenine glycosylase I n=1 Tax=Arthrobacter glacialis TaxID=1664 RepID=A0A2S3ZSL9_ARTGL|nr:DNA-3-methyladenine glycosylase I [Arthrobacter glacialis]POH72251.1 DNA-3-methyladenine glycosylase I [Arthrobacter glacialis]
MDLVSGTDAKARCAWAGIERDEQYQQYHDTEWGRPVTGEAELFERLSLEAFQSGLSWLTILRKRESFRRAFGNFEPAVVAAFGQDDIDRLMADASIVRNLMKINATIGNARALLALPQGTTLSQLLASHAPAAVRGAGEPIPGKTAESLQLAKVLKKHGFAFVGPTTAYAMMQAVGIVNDHQPGCWLAAPLDAAPAAPLGRDLAPSGEAPEWP